jgi:hypothetical protein
VPGERTMEARPEAVLIALAGGAATSAGAGRALASGAAGLGAAAGAAGAAAGAGAGLAGAVALLVADVLPTSPDWHAVANAPSATVQSAPSTRGEKGARQRAMERAVVGGGAIIMVRASLLESVSAGNLPRSRDVRAPLLCAQQRRPPAARKFSYGAKPCQSRAARATNQGANE